MNAITTTVEVNGKIQYITVQGDMLSTLVANPHEEICPLDLDQTLSYSLSPASIPPGSADSSKRKMSARKSIWV